MSLLLCCKAGVLSACSVARAVPRRARRRPGAALRRTHRLTGAIAVAGAENAEELWQNESAALEEAMRLIRERLEQDVPDATAGDSDDLLPVQLSDLVSPTSIASNPFAALGASCAVAPSENGQVKDFPESIGGVIDMISDYQGRCPGGKPPDLRSEQTVEPEIKMCADSDLQAPRPTLTVAEYRPGASGFSTRVRIIQHICYIDTSDAGKIVEWLVGDETGVCVLKTTEPVADRLHLGIWCVGSTRLRHPTFAGALSRVLLLCTSC